MILELRITLIEGDEHVNPVKNCPVPKEQKVQRSLGRKNLMYFRNRKKACMDGKKEKEVKRVGMGHSIRDFKCQSSASILSRQYNDILLFLIDKDHFGYCMKNRLMEILAGAGTAGRSLFKYSG